MRLIDNLFRHPRTGMRCWLWMSRSKSVWRSLEGSKPSGVWDLPNHRVLDHPQTLATAWSKLLRHDLRLPWKEEKADEKEIEAREEKREEIVQQKRKEALERARERSDNADEDASSKTTSNPWKDVDLMGLARFDYSEDNDSRILRFRKGDVFFITGEAVDWYRAYILGTKRVGMVPSNFLEAMTPEEALLKLRDLENKLREVKAERNKSRSQLSSLKQKAVGVLEALKTSGEENARLSLQNTQQDLQISQLNYKLEKMQQNVYTLQELLEEKQGQLNQSREIEESMQKEIAESLRQKQASIQAQHDKEELERLRSENDALKKENADLKKSLGTTRAIVSPRAPKQMQQIEPEQDSTEFDTEHGEDEEEKQDSHASATKDDADIFASLTGTLGHKEAQKLHQISQGRDQKQGAAVWLSAARRVCAG